MSKQLNVYPISTGNELDIFANHSFNKVKIMDMAGNVVYNSGHKMCNRCTLNIRALPFATYIVEVSYSDNNTARSVFVKT